MRILGIETSCDDTGVAIFDSETGLVCHSLASQVELHREYGGVVPELAARDHIRTLLPVVDFLVNDENNQGRIPDAIAYTAGPGLAGASRWARRGGLGGSEVAPGSLRGAPPVPS